MLTTLMVLSPDQGKLSGDAPTAEDLAGGLKTDLAWPAGEPGRFGRNWIRRLASLLAAMTSIPARAHPVS